MCLGCVLIYAAVVCLGVEIVMQVIVSQVSSA
ncbi:Uncharacterised protein [Mobiluncus curtisii subsp. curtisii]|uniref:Uncharacterized protein n=1 Tax=Mobiluncus curtisii TaxID=2051 RepID=A0A2X2YSI1_9ACTO|nr:Uncharacterised protein [Mobiluncus curtisii]STY76586.1 Uncharacterised protein [Mobiluncus curtisii subsp. curtisii]STY89254.1 Uncharacterised protein [Mobiluncus holmesii]